MNYFVKINNFTFEISKTIANTLKKNYADVFLETQGNSQTLTLNESILSSFQVVKTTSQTHFYVLISNKKYRISKNLYSFLE